LPTYPGIIWTEELGNKFLSHKNPKSCWYHGSTSHSADLCRVLYPQLERARTSNNANGTKDKPATVKKKVKKNRKTKVDAQPEETIEESNFVDEIEDHNPF